MSEASARFGFWTLTFLVIANMVGAGVFTTSGFTLQSLLSPDLVILAWFVGGLIAMAGAFSYGRLACAMPESGGEYLFLSRAAHPLLGFIAGWVSLIAGFTGAIAFAATAFESYVVPESARPAWLPADAIAVAMVVVSGCLHGLRWRVGAVLQNAAVTLKLFLLCSFLVLAASDAGSESWKGAPLGAQPDPLTGGLAFAESLVWISLSYAGFNAAVYVAGEARHPQRDLPRSLLTGTLVVLLLYVALNAVFVKAPPPEAIAGRPDVAAVAAQWIGGTRVALGVRSIIAIGLLTSVSSMVMAAPRVYAKMADDGLMPGWLSSRGDVPRAAVVAQVVLASSIILISDLQELLGYLGLTLSLSSALSVACLFLPGMRRGTISITSDMVAVLYVLATIGAAAAMTLRDPRQLVATAVTFLVGVVVYVIVHRNGKNSGRRGALQSGP